MLKRFLISFLGGVAGTWTSVFLAMAAFFLMFMIMLASVGNSTGAVAKVGKRSVLYINLSGEIVDRETVPEFFKSIYYDSSTQSLQDILASLDQAADDERIEGVFIDCLGANPGMAGSEALNRALDEFRKSGKWVISYADSYTQGNYYIGCHADSVFINPSGVIDLHGLSSTTPFFKNLLDKLGVEMQVVKVGTYKSAVEPYILTSMSDASREQQKAFLDNMWGVVRESIAKARNVKADVIDALADSMLITVDAKEYEKMKLVDGLRYRHEVESTLMALTDNDDLDDVNFITPAQYCQEGALERSLSRGKDKKIAVLYALGDIVDYGSADISAEWMVPQIERIMKDEDVDGLILRVNSPGGSAFASEQIWEALERYKEVTGNPYFVSMGDYAASGGYYISCGADCIYAEPLTLTGSIGIFGMIPNLQGTFNDHLGITFETVKTNRNGAFPTLLEPMSPSQREAMQGMINRGYELFVSRVAAGRGMTVSQVKSIAEGRVWDGKKALSIGLVDKQGGLELAIRDMADRLGTTVDDCRVVEYPRVEYDFWKGSLTYVSMQLKDMLLADELSPEMLELYGAIGRLKSMNCVQCRMPMMEIN